jgi:hypothetical protein
MCGEKQMHSEAQDTSYKDQSGQIYIFKAPLQVIYFFKAVLWC